MSDLYKILRSCSYFAGIPEDKYMNVLHCLQAERRCFQKDITILEMEGRSETGWNCPIGHGKTATI